VTQAHIGPDDLHLFESPRPDLLQSITGIAPEADGDHVRLDRHTNVRSTQRVALSALGTGFIVGFWPAELKPQAEFLYRDGRALAMLEAAEARGWETYPSPQLAFYTSPPALRLYVHPPLTAREYATQWEGDDGRMIGQYRRDEVWSTLWPWLKHRGFVSDADERELADFLQILGRRPAHLRPGLRIRKQWDSAGSSDVREAREDLGAVLTAAGDSRLAPTTVRK